MKRFVTLVSATWFGAGYSPIAPGTAGTALALPFAFVFVVASDFFLGNVAVLGGWNLGNLIAGAVLFYPGVVAATRTEVYVGRHDPGLVVIDEAVGLFFTLAFLPADSLFYAGTYVWAFFVFRLLDIWKPGWIDRSQHLPRGWGVMVDDVLAGLVGGVFLFVLNFVFPAWMQWGDLLPWADKVLHGLGG